MTRLLCPVQLATAALSAVAGTSPAAIIRWNFEAGTTTVALTGLAPEAAQRFASIVDDPEKCAQVFRVTVEGASRPILGTYRRTDTEIEFKPRFRLDSGTNYVAVYDESKLVSGSASKPLTAVYRREIDESAEKTRILRVDPSLNVVPENLLKFYLTFSAPMSRGQVYSRARILDEAGKPVELAFLELGEELWDPTQTRITLLFDPGRIKSGLRPREEDGPILVAGKTYTLVVDAEWPDAAGRPLKQGLKHVFKAGPADLKSPDPKTWKLTAPAASTLDPIKVEFGETLDRALASRVIAVEDASGESVEGKVTLDEHTRVWTFRPAQPWKAGSYVVSVVPTLEDLAGNSVAKPFEVDVFQVDRPEVKTQPVKLPVSIR